MHSFTKDVLDERFRLGVDKFIKWYHEGWQIDKNRIKIIIVLP